MKNLKIPRKLKKEIVKVESIVKQPYWVNPQSFGVRLKSGVKVNKWTVKLINKIIAEQKRIVRKVYSSNLENMKVQIDSLSFVLEAVQNDAQIKALNKKLNDLYMYSTPKYVMQTNGSINPINSKEFDETVANIVEQINLRRQQIMSAYNCQ